MEIIQVVTSPKRTGDGPGWLEDHLSEVAKAWPGLDMEVEGLLTRVEKVQRYFDRILTDTVREFDLSRGEYKVLITLKGAGDRPSSPGELSDRLLVSSGAMTNRLDQLESAGLIRRDPDPSDRRGVLVSLTEAGATRVEEAVYTQARKEKELIDVLSEGDRQHLRAAFGALLKALDERYGPPPRKRLREDE